MSEVVASGIIKCEYLQQYLDVFTPLVGEGKWHFSEDGITASVCDPANVAMYRDTQLHRAAFEALDAPGQVTLGLNFVRLDELLGSANSDDLVEWGIDMETRKLQLRYRGIEHEMAFIDPDAVRHEPDNPDLEFPNHAVVESGMVSEAVKNCDLTSDHIFLRGETDPEAVVFHAKGDTDDTTVRVEADECVRSDVTEAVESVLSLEYLKELVKPIPDGVDVTLHFDDEFPMIFEWGAFDDTLYVEGLLAPRIQTN